MSEAKELLIERAVAMRKEIDKYEIKLSRIVAALYSCSENFAEDCDLIGIGYRKGMYLVAVYENIVAHKFVPETELHEIGWTKLSKLTAVICEDTNKATARKWLRMAKDTSVSKLALLIEGKHSSVKSIVFRLSKTEATALDAVLVKFGMVITGAGKCRYTDRDLAFMRMVKAAEEVTCQP